MCKQEEESRTGLTVREIEAVRGRKRMCMFERDREMKRERKNIELEKERMYVKEILREI